MIATGARELILMIVMACLVVLVAMVVDLASGLYKAKLRGDVRSSAALKRSIYKFLTYEGAMVVAACIDVLMHLAHFFPLIGLGALDSVACVTILVGIFLCVVELLSVREKADSKTHAQMRKVEGAVAKVSDKVVERVVDAILDRITDKIKKDKENGND